MAVAVALLMVVAPVTNASGLKIPLKSLGVTISTSTTSGACGSAKVVKPLTFSTVTGTILGSVSAKSPACSHRVSENQAYATDSMNLANPNFHFPRNGVFTLSLNWSFKVNETWSMTPYSKCTLNYADPASICDVYTEDTIYAQPYIYDSTNSTWNANNGFYFGTSVDLYLNSFAYRQNSTYGNYSFGSAGAGSFAGTLYGNNTFNLMGKAAINASNHFYFYVIFEIQTLTFAYSQDAVTLGAASATASINMSSAGNVGHLIKITLS
ncbi:MAG TPA: hypothetical protein VGV89_08280 [Thermoplasmata archaeon]|nr:hypothetical protein [Thermoplasmata archaeon]